MLKRLPDGTQILIRPIRPDDKGMLEQGLHNLSETSVQRRFLTPKPSFSRSELRYLTEVDGRNHVALVAERPNAPVRALIGVARYVRLPDDPEAAEVAVVVADHWQGRGHRHPARGRAGAARPRPRQCAASPPRWPATTRPPTGCSRSSPATPRSTATAP